jgi:hypothetical protein
VVLLEYLSSRVNIYFLVFALGKTAAMYVDLSFHLIIFSENKIGCKAKGQEAKAPT